MSDVIETTVEGYENSEVLTDFETEGLIEVTQLPVIVERLYQIRDTVLQKVESALSLECTEENKQLVRTERAALNKLFKELEAKRIEVKNAVLAPYNNFEALYKECVTSIFKPADAQLKEKIEAVELEQKAQKRQVAYEYFEEYRVALGIDFVTFDDVGLNITLNISDKKLKAECKAFLDKVMESLSLIATQEHQEEILVEYKQSLNAAQAITTVSERYKRIEEEKQRRAEAEARRQAEIERQAEIDAVVAEETAAQEEIEAFSAPTAEDISVPDIPQEEPRKKYIVSFRYETYDKESIGRIVEIMKENGTYEQL